MDAVVASMINQGVNSGTSIVDGILTRNWNEEQIDKQWKRNLEQWHRENAYNSPVQQVQRMKQAGLNPALAYMNGGSFVPAATSPEAGASRANQYGLATQLDPLMMAQVDLMKAQAEDARASARNKDVDSEDKSIDLIVKRELHNEDLLTKFERSRIFEQFQKEGISTAQALTQIYDYLVYTGQFSIDDGKIVYEYQYADHPTALLSIDDNEVTEQRRKNMIGSEEEKSKAIEAAKVAHDAMIEYEKKRKMEIESEEQYLSFLMANKDEWWSIVLRGAYWLLKKGREAMPNVTLRFGRK